MNNHLTIEEVERRSTCMANIGDSTFFNGKLTRSQMNDHQKDAMMMMSLETLKVYYLKQYPSVRNSIAIDHANAGGA